MSEEKKDRKVFFSSTERNKDLFVSNYISTSKYTAITFFPQALLLQFRRYANLYFLLMAILQSFPQISPVNPFSSIAPLMFVISLSIIREGFEDLARHRSDLELNSSTSIKYLDCGWHKINWKDIYVGDIVKVACNEFLPADLICLASSDSNGICFIETSSLDGEKNLKPRQAFKQTQNQIGRGSVIRLVGEMTLPPPDPDLHNAGGHIKIGSDRELGITIDNFLLRGSVLRSTDWIIGVCAYTGKDTKIMKNNEESNFKQSNVDKKTNHLIVLIFLFQVACCFTISVINWIWSSIYLPQYKGFIPNDYSPFVTGLLSFGTILVLTNSMIPISLVISLEMVKLAQAHFIGLDEEMYTYENNRYAKVFSSSLNEELGQVEYIFSDKTGTLTCNKMEFKMCVIGDVLYGEDDCLRDDYMEIKKRKTMLMDDNDLRNIFSFVDKRLERLDMGLKEDKDICLQFMDARNKQETFRYKKQYEIVFDYFLLLSVCHECVVETEEDGMRYQGESPDEIALVKTASQVGFRFIGSGIDYKLVNILGVDYKIKELQYFPFNSTRKRASVIIRHQGKIKMMIKGADTFIIDRLGDSEHHPQPYLDRMKVKLKTFSSKGLRTLLMGVRIISPEEYAEIERKINNTHTAKDPKEAILEIAEEYENGFTLIGCSAVEDKLQDGVPETIRDFLKADIKVWMLTGDKLETAQNIGYSCKLIQEDFEKLVIKADDHLLTKYEECKERVEELNRKGVKKALLMEGKAITKMLSKEELKNNLINNVMTKCESVICCRVSPKEKADVVRIVKHNLGKITLSIGDGANDANMIQEAHVGIGIYGQEGMRAVQASDYAFSEFKSLWKLLMVHGRWSYIRISEMILYFFYKNMIFTIPQVIFCLINAYSGQSIFDDWYIASYNLAFTSIPLVVRAVFDQDLDYKTWKKSGRTQIVHTREELKENYPYLYYVGQRNEIFNDSNMLKWISHGILLGTVMFFMVIYFIKNQALQAEGYTADIWFISLTLYTCIITMVDMKLALYTKTWTWMNWMAIILFSCVIYLAFVYFGDMLTFFNSYKTAVMVLYTPQFYLCIAFFVVVTFVIDMTTLVLKKEAFTPLRLFFSSIIRRHKEKEPHIFKKIVLNFKKSNTKPIPEDPDQN